MFLFFSLLLLVLDIWALMSTLGSSATVLAKLLWSILVLIFPVVGFIIWYFAGPKRL